MLSLWFFINSVLWPFNFEIAGLKLGLNVVVSLLTGMFWLFWRSRISIPTVKVLLALLGYFLSATLVAVAGPCQDKFLKMAFTAPVFFFLALVGLEIGWKLADSEWLRLRKSAMWVLTAAFAGLLTEMLFPAIFPSGEGYRVDSKYSGLFSEPSLVAVSLFPAIIVLLLAKDRRTRLWGMSAVLGLFILSRSSTLISLVICWMAYRALVLRKLTVGVVLWAILAFAGAWIATSYSSVVDSTIDRAIGVAAGEETGNISSLVYQQGWQDAWFNLQRTYGLGLGFNMMGCTPLPAVGARIALNRLIRIELNSEDGSILFGKVASEAGIFGVLLFLVLIWRWIGVEVMIRRQRNDEKTRAVSIQTALVFSFITTSLIRSSGYFSGGLLLLIVAVPAMTRWAMAAGQAGSAKREPSQLA